MYKLSKKQKKALRNNAKRHARKHGEHRRRIQTILRNNYNNQEARQLLRMMEYRW